MAAKNEYLSREAAVKAITRGLVVTDDLYGMGVQAGIDYAKSKIEKTPAAENVIPVIYCRYCAYCVQAVCVRGGLKGVHAVEPYDFCSYGRKPDGDDIYGR